MATTIDDILTAIDTYMANNGLGDEYLAKKISSIFDERDSVFNVTTGPLKILGDRIGKLTKKIDALGTNTEKVADKLMTFSKSLKISNLNLLNTRAESLANKMSKYRDSLINIKGGDFQKSLDRMKDKVGSFSRDLKYKDFQKAMESLAERMKDFRKAMNVRAMRDFIEDLKTHKRKGSAKKENILSDKPVLVVIDDVDNRVVQKLRMIMNRLRIDSDSFPERRGRDDESPSLLRKVLNTFVGGIAMLAGIGMISEFLTQTELGKNLANTAKNIGSHFLKKLKPVLNSLVDSVWKGISVVLKGVEAFMKSTFNFFGLKEALGEHMEGTAVIITKAIYYSIKHFSRKVMDFFTGGFYTKGMTYIQNNMVRPIFEKAGNFIISIGNWFSRAGKALFKPLAEVADSLTRHSLPRLSKLITDSFGSTKASSSIITKTLTKVTGVFAKLAGFGTKIVGKMVTNIGKRIPFVGMAISMYDMWQRLQKGDLVGAGISLASGIASFFPGVGTAISIGLDILNAILDKKSEGGFHSKASIIGNWVSPLIERISQGMHEFIYSIFDFIVKIINGATDMVKDVITNGPYEYMYSKLMTLTNHKTGSGPVTQAELDEFRRIHSYKNKPRPIQDAEVLIPDKKDVHVFAKGGGPFDIALKESNARLTELKQIMEEGFQALAMVSAQGSSNVVKAVVSSGGKADSAPVIGGRDPIREFRERANSAINRIDGLGK